MGEWAVATRIWKGPIDVGEKWNQTQKGREKLGPYAGE